jgi:hypothetical protein
LLWTTNDDNANGGRGGNRRKSNGPAEIHRRSRSPGQIRQLGVFVGRPATPGASVHGFGRAGNVAALESLAREGGNGRRAQAGTTARSGVLRWFLRRSACSGRSGRPRPLSVVLGAGMAVGLGAGKWWPSILRMPCDRELLLRFRHLGSDGLLRRFAADRLSTTRSRG